MQKSTVNRTSEEGSAGAKALIIFVVLGLIAHAGINYVPVAYNGANFRSEMDTAVVKGLAAAGRMKPLEVVTASVQEAARQNDIPADALIDVRPENGVVIAHVAYTQNVNMLPFGLYKYKYDFDYMATPKGYLLKQ